VTFVPGLIEAVAVAMKSPNAAECGEPQNVAKMFTFAKWCQSLRKRSLRLLPQLQKRLGAMGPMA
jgi:hypothetical protein